MYKSLNKAVMCADGFSMSVQASSTAYSEPRDNIGPYTKAEVGFPSQPEEMLLKYAEDPDKPTETVYGWVPRQIIINVVAKHGGIVSGDLPAGFPILQAVSSDAI